MHGTTVSTNAVIERMGPRIALFTTDGSIDLLTIQRLRLKDPTNLFSGRVQPLIPRDNVFEIKGRHGADARIDRPCDRQPVVHAPTQASTRGFAGAHACFVQRYRSPDTIPLGGESEHEPK